MKKKHTCITPFHIISEHRLCISCISKVIYVGVGYIDGICIKNRETALRLRSCTHWPEVVDSDPFVVIGVP